ncbi:unnamed protein product [Nesidiocoris tenuis]|uniref:Uncharacterized protein n=1 Tax=Nesidiocoris tenuis TaxID=355587 RepID=A0A6H5GV34_9HEMI|nr:unnamed protein product [Nesidiocoris tenuis]
MCFVSFNLADIDVLGCYPWNRRRSADRCLAYNPSAKQSSRNVAGHLRRCCNASQPRVLSELYLVSK